MLPKFEYIIPSSLSETLNFLRDHGLVTKIIAGGTDLIPSLRRGEMKPRFLLDISTLDELHQVEDVGDQIMVGAACTHTQIVESPVLKKYGGILSEASAWVASPQIRNLGTIGGNIVNGSPAADTVPALMVLNGKLKIISKRDQRHVFLHEIYTGPYQTNLKPDEMISHIIIEKIPDGAHYHFFRVARRKAMATARINGAVLLWKKNGCGPIEEIRISVGSVTPIPCRMIAAEKILMGTIPSEEMIEEACMVVGQAMVEVSGIRRSTEYKKPVVSALVNRAIKHALEK